MGRWPRAAADFQPPLAHAAVARLRRTEAPPLVPSPADSDRLRLTTIIALEPELTVQTLSHAISGNQSARA